MPILVPTDFSPNAQKAYATALALAQLQNTNIELFHLMVMPLDWMRLPKTQEGNYPELKAQIAEAQAQLRAAEQEGRAQGVEVKSSLAFEASMQNFWAHVAQHQPRCIVMGSDGKQASEASEWLLGSNAQKVIRQSQVPVWIVKHQSPQPLQLQRLVFVSDFRQEAPKAFEQLLPLLKQFPQVEIVLLYLNTPQRFEESWKSLARLYAFMEHFPQYQFKPHVYNAFEEAAGIQHFAQAYGMDLIALGTHGKGALSQLLSPSLAEEVANLAQGSVLVLPLRG